MSETAKSTAAGNSQAVSGIVTRIIEGRIGKEIAITAVGEKNGVANFSIAVNRATRTKEGTTKTTTWFNLKAWNGMARALQNSAGKGDLFKFRVRVTPNTWTNGEGKVVEEEVLTVERFKPIKRARRNREA